MDAATPRIDELSPAAATQSFSMQYLSLILIILTFIIGVFASHHAQKQKYLQRLGSSEASTSSVPKLPRIETFGSMQLPDAFAENTAILNVEAMEGLSQVLKSHDIRIQAEVADERSASPSLAIARSATLSRFFLGRGVPSEALEIVAVEGIRPWQVEVRFSTGEPHVE